MSLTGLVGLVGYLAEFTHEIWICSLKNLRPGRILRHSATTIGVGIVPGAGQIRRDTNSSLPEKGPSWPLTGWCGGEEEGVISHEVLLDFVQLSVPLSPGAQSLPSELSHLHS